MDMLSNYIGIVHNGRFHLLDPEPTGDEPVMLTTIQMTMALPPELHQLDLTEYEGRAIMVRGYDPGGCIYEAHVIDQASPILTAVVQRLFRSGLAEAKGEPT